jgi:hypothetical protein
LLAINLDVIYTYSDRPSKAPHAAHISLIGDVYLKRGLRGVTFSIVPENAYLKHAPGGSIAINAAGSSDGDSLQGSYNAQAPYIRTDSADCSHPVSEIAIPRC